MVTLSLVVEVNDEGVNMRGHFFTGCGSLFSQVRLLRLCRASRTIWARTASELRRGAQMGGACSTSFS